MAIHGLYVENKPRARKLTPLHVAEFKRALIYKRQINDALENWRTESGYTAL